MYNFLRQQSTEALEKGINSLKTIFYEYTDSKHKLLKDWEENEGKEAFGNYLSLKEEDFPTVYSIGISIHHSHLGFGYNISTFGENYFTEKKEKLFQQKVKYYLASLTILMNVCLGYDASEYEEDYNDYFSLINPMYKTDTLAGRVLIDDIDKEIKNIFYKNQELKPTRLTKEGFFINNKLIAILSSTTRYYKFIKLLISKNGGIASYEEIYNICSRKKNHKPEQISIFCNKLRYEFLQKIKLDTDKEIAELCTETIISSEDSTNDGKVIKGYKIVL